MLESGGLRYVRQLDPCLGQRVEVGASLVPGARRRNANHVDPLRDTIPRKRWVATCREQFLQFGGPTRAAAEVLAERRDRDLHVNRAELLACASPPFLARLLHRGQEERVVPRRDHVYRAAQQGALDHLAPLERRRERATLEVVETRPETDVARRRVLGL